jgi:hypothetical protein
MDTSGKLVSPQMEPIKVLALAIQQEINIPDGNVMLGLENWKIPNDTGLYLSLIYGTEQVIANNNYSAVDANGNFQEVQSAVMLHAIDVDIMSFDSSARVQKQAVLWALQSVNAQNLMEKYQMRIARMPQSFVPVETMEATKQLNRFRLSVMVNAVHTNVKTADFFDALQPIIPVTQP